jgi:hypothetical protein
MISIYGRKLVSCGICHLPSSNGGASFACSYKQVTFHQNISLTNLQDVRHVSVCLCWPLRICNCLFLCTQHAQTRHLAITAYTKPCNIFQNHHIIWWSYIFFLITDQFCNRLELAGTNTWLKSAPVTVNVLQKSLLQNLLLFFVRKRRYAQNLIRQRIEPM